MLLKPGTTLHNNSYRIIQTLGRGGFGVTYLAEQIMTRREVCIKEFFPKDYYKREGDSSAITISSDGFAEAMNRFKAKFIKEAQTIAALDHPNIIHIHEAFEENGTAYYVMEYIDGESLNDTIKRSGAMAESEAVAYIKQVASALEYIHNQQIMHLDVKPGNIMVRSKDNRAILIDFGLSKHYDTASGEATSTTPVGVSHGFAPMEQYNPGGVSTFSPETDIYSLGATLYYLVTGNIPPSATDISEDGLPALPSHLSTGVRTVIERSMNAQRKQRPHNIQEFITLLPTSSTKKNSSLKYLWITLITAIITSLVVLVIINNNIDKSDDDLNDIENNSHIEKVIVNDEHVVIENTTQAENKVIEQNLITHPAQQPGLNYTASINNAQFNMIWVEGGSFTMGDYSDIADEDEHNTHVVTLDGFWISETEVTQALWKAVMGTSIEQQCDKTHSTWSLWGEGPDYPMYYVNYKEALSFCRELSSSAQLTYTLPTEAQWEYAARGGKNSMGNLYSGSNNIDLVCHSLDKNSNGTYRVKQYEPNELGLYDMSGNVWEWCLDWYEPYSSNAQTNPIGPRIGEQRVLRGGGWRSEAQDNRTTNRNRNLPSERHDYYGFRIVCIPVL